VFNFDLLVALDEQCNHFIILLYKCCVTLMNVSFTLHWLILQRLETCKNVIERDDRARKQLGLDTPDLDELRAMTGVKVITGSDRKETLMQLGVLDRPRRSYQRDSRDFNRDSRDRKRM